MTICCSVSISVSSIHGMLAQMIKVREYGRTRRNFQIFECYSINNFTSHYSAFWIFLLQRKAYAISPKHHFSNYTFDLTPKSRKSSHLISLKFAAFNRFEWKWNKFKLMNLKEIWNTNIHLRLPLILWDKFIINRKLPGIKEKLFIITGRNLFADYSKFPAVSFTLRNLFLELPWSFRIEIRKF